MTIKIDNKLPKLKLNSLVSINIAEHIAVVTWKHEKELNPFSFQLMSDLQNAILSLNDNESVDTILLTGGQDRSFSAGGDFNEVSRMDTSEKVIYWLDRLYDLYESILSSEKLTIALVDGYSIGVGMQVAMCCDLRFATLESKFIMPELKHGISCTIGQYMLGSMFSRSVMQNIVYGCDEINLDKALKLGLVYQEISSDCLIQSGIDIANKFTGYASTPLVSTKKAINHQFIEGLKGIMTVSKDAHVKSFTQKTAAKHFENVLKTSGE